MAKTEPKVTSAVQEKVKPPTKRELKKQRLLEQIVRMRHLDRLTVQEVAQKLKISERAVYKYCADPAYDERVLALRKEWGEATRTSVYETGAKVIETLKELMSPATKSEHVRFEAAAKLGDWMGLSEQLQQEEQGDDRSEMQRLLTLLEERTRPIDTMAPGFFEPPKPGGFLPSATVSEVGKELEAFFGRRQASDHASDEIIEGTYSVDTDDEEELVDAGDLFA